jgi:signal transduction histidine kinase
VLSLASELLNVPANNWWDTVFYLILTVTGPVWLGWSVRLLTELQRARLQVFPGVRLAPLPPIGAGSWRRRLGYYWRAPATWRQVGYHLVTLVTGPVLALLTVVVWAGGLAVLAATGSATGAVLVVVLPFVAPAVVRGSAALDVGLARRLLGPSRSEELALRVASLTRSRSEVVEATDAERRRIERDLHDGAQQRLVSLAMNLGLARARLTDVPEPARQAIVDAHEEAKQALVELRDLVRGLHPAVLNDRGLDAALSGIATRSPVPVRLRVDVAARCAPTIEAVAYFVVSEALTNVAKHAAATEAEVVVARAGNRLRLVVTDDGRGGAPTTGGAPTSGGGGLLGLAQRVAAVDGTLTITSPVGGPTRITAELPCGS